MEYIVLYNYTPKGDDELELKKGQLLTILSKDEQISGDDGWFVAKLNNKIGIVPSNFIIKNVHNIKDIVIGGQIGEGGFSKVYHGYYGNTSVAVKISKGITKESIYTEGKINMKLKHDNIVEFIGFWEGNIVLEYLNGGCLFNLLKSVDELDYNIIIDFSKQICDGMGYLHEHNIIHRDLKSSNVLLAHPPTNNSSSSTSSSSSPHYKQIIKITDFGLAREINHTIRISTAAGTYAWMSPEVIKINTYSKSSDIWSYGVLLWELLTCEIPYKNIEPFTIAYGIAVNKLTLPIHGNCPKIWRFLMEACWNEEPNQRPTFTYINNLLNNIDDGDDEGDVDGAGAAPPEQGGAKKYYFNNIPWKLSIDSELKPRLINIDHKEKELTTRENKIKQIYGIQKEVEFNLKNYETYLKNKELDLIKKELEITLANKPVAKKRKAKFNKKLLKNYYNSTGSSSSDHHHHHHHIEISHPSDFRHTLTIQMNGGGGVGVGTTHHHQNVQSHYFNTTNGIDRNKYFSLPNLFKKKTSSSSGETNCTGAGGTTTTTTTRRDQQEQQRREQVQPNNINNIIYKMSTMMIGTIGINIGPMNPDPLLRNDINNIIKYNTYHGPRRNKRKCIITEV